MKKLEEHTVEQLLENEVRVKESLRKAKEAYLQEQQKAEK